MSDQELHAETTEVADTDNASTSVEDVTAIEAETRSQLATDVGDGEALPADEGKPAASARPTDIPEKFWNAEDGGARQRRWDGSVNQDGTSADAGLVT